MKKLIFILFLIACTKFEFDPIQAQTTWYISPSGNNANPGTLAQPKANFYNMITDPDVETGDEIIALDGTYNETQQVSNFPYVSIRAENPRGARIESTYAGSNQPLWKLETSNGWLGTYGNQVIEGLVFDGNLTTWSAIQVNFRSNIKIRNCAFEHFYGEGVIFYGMQESSWGGSNPYEAGKPAPDYRTTGNEVTNCTFTDCAIYTTEGKGNLRFGQQLGMIVEYNTITQTARATGSNGYGIKFYMDGWNRGSRVRYNTIKVARHVSGKFNFALEIWYEEGGEYAYNDIEGCCDFDVVDKGTYDYGFYFHHNTVGYTSVGSTDEVGIDIEGRCHDVIIEKNIVRNVSEAIYMSQIWPNAEHSDQNEFDNFDINTNLLYNIGRLNSGSTTGIVCAMRYGGVQSSLNTVSNFDIYNNVAIASGDFHTNTYDSFGWGLPHVTTTSNYNLRNNITIGFIGGYRYNAPVYGWGTTTNTNLKIEYNIHFGNGNSNDPLYWNNGGLFVPGAGYSYTNTTKQDPLFISTVDFHLQAGSPAIAAGVAVGLTTDYAGLNWLTIPSIGAYEYTTSTTLPTLTTTTVSDITATTASSGGSITSDGGAVVTARGICFHTTANPTTARRKIAGGTGTGVFTSAIVGLTADSVYYVRAYATNSVGTAYGSQRTFTASSAPAAIILLKHAGTLIKINNTAIKQ